MIARAGRTMAVATSETLSRDVRARLRQVGRLAPDAPLQVEIERLQVEIGQLSATWRRLLHAHGADDEARCRRYTTWLGRPRRWPCRVWRSARRELLVEATSAVGRRAAHRRHA